MKQTILYIFALLVLVPSSLAQEIAIDEENANGKFVATNFLPVYQGENGTAVELSLGVAYNTAMQTLFCLNLKVLNEQNLHISKGSALQLVTKDGQIIVLHNTSDIESSNSTANSIIVSYGVQYNEVELANLDQIMNERITKIKIETDNGILVKDVINNRFSKSVYSCFLILKKHLESIR